MRRGKTPTENVDTTAYDAGQSILSGIGRGINTTGGKLPATYIANEPQSSKLKALGTQGEVGFQ